MFGHVPWHDSQVIVLAAVGTDPWFTALIAVAVALFLVAAVVLRREHQGYMIAMFGFAALAGAFLFAGNPHP